MTSDDGYYRYLEEFVWRRIKRKSREINLKQELKQLLISAYFSSGKRLKVSFGKGHSKKRAKKKERETEREIKILRNLIAVKM